MAKGGKLSSPFKSMLKKWKSSSNLTCTGSGSIASSSSSSSARSSDSHEGLQEVYVGKSRRPYLLSSHLVDHPLFRQLLVQGQGGESDALTVGCEVVLFEHLLWMLENADPQPDSLEDLVHFYAL